ncbi:hypothetical protein BDW74DRAFT_182761 [Aspergillus multicolor]|uniref:uncharacterized protein n=1 Tax=Aspergillus multicolor TaxID=41759 RepID=UPI003CCDE444
MSSSSADSSNPEPDIHSPLQQTPAQPKKVFVLCRPLYDDDPNPKFLGPWTITEEEAEELIKDAPMPSHNFPHGGRAHAHYDHEGLFTEEEKQALEQLLELAAPAYEGKRAKMWGYPSCLFNYAQSVGDPGPHRIITDRYKKILGIISHPKGDKANFKRAIAISVSD